MSKGVRRGGGATEPNPPIFGATKTIEFLTKEASTRSRVQDLVAGGMSEREKY